MTGKALGRVARGCRAEHIEDSTVFGRIANQRRRAVEIDVVDCIRFHPSTCEGSLEREACTQTFWMGRGHVIGVGALTIPKKQNRIGTMPVIWPLEQDEPRRLAN